MLSIDSATRRTAAVGTAGTAANQNQALTQILDALKQIQSLLKSLQAQLSKQAGGAAGGSARAGSAQPLDSFTPASSSTPARRAAGSGEDSFSPADVNQRGSGAPVAQPGGASDVSQRESGAPVEGAEGAQSAGNARGGEFPGDNSTQPSFGGWAWSRPDPNAIARAGFNWFETGYPDTMSSADYKTLRDGGVRPFAYVNMGEVTPDLRDKAGNPPVLKHNGEWNTDIVDVRDPGWQKWLIDRANYAYDRGARGIKWDCAGIEGQYSDPAQKQQALEAMGNVLATLKQQHPDFKFIVNQGYGLANKYPELVDGFETESLMSALDQGGGMAQWGNEEIAKVKELHEKFGMPIFMADYADPSSDTAKRWADTISSWGLTPYITSNQWNIPGRGLNINPGW